MENEDKTEGDSLQSLPVGEQKARKQRKWVPGPVIPTGSDTSHLATCHAVLAAQCSPGEMRHGWHPNLKK